MPVVSSLYGNRTPPDDRPPETDEIVAWLKTDGTAAWFAKVEASGLTPTEYLIAEIRATNPAVGCQSETGPDIGCEFANLAAQRQQAGLPSMRSEVDERVMQQILRANALDDI